MIDHAIVWMVALLLSWGALAFGAVYEWAYRPLLVGAMLIGVIAWLRAPARRVNLSIVALLLLLALAIAVQLIPVNRDTIQRLTPNTDRLLMATDVQYSIAAGSSAAVHPFSVSPTRTLQGLAFLTCGGIYVIGLAAWLTRERLRAVAIGVVIVSAMLAMLGIVLGGDPSDPIYGFWKTEQFGDPFGPFVNKNHFAGWMVMSAPVALGLAVGLAVRHARGTAGRHHRLLNFAQPDSAWAAVALFAGFVMVLALLMTLSRSGILTIVATLAFGSFLLIRESARTSQRVVRRGFARGGAATAVILLVSAVAWAGLDSIAARFAVLNEGSYHARVGMWADALRVIRDFPLTGVGILSYTVASHSYQTVLPEYHVGSAHNDWLQVAAEGGVLVGVPAALTLWAIARAAYNRFEEHWYSNDLGTTYWIRIGTALGLFAIGLQSLVEFSLRIPANTLLFATLVAMLLARPVSMHRAPARS